jgi:hypothetical protein
VTREELAPVLRAAAELVDVGILLERVDLVDLPEGVKARLRSAVDRCSHA